MICRRPARASWLAAAALGLLGLTACQSQPSAKAVAEDIVEQVPGLTETERSCLRDKLADDYDTDQLEALGDANLDVDWSQEGALEQTSEEFQAFVEDLRRCVEG